MSDDLGICKRCRRTIRFVYLENGKRVPADDSAGRLVAFKDVDGSYVRGYFRKAADEWYPFGAVLFNPHSDSCRKAPERHAPDPAIMAKIRADIAAARAREVQ